MRSLRISGAILLVLLVGFVALGFIQPSVLIETTSRTSRSPSVAFHEMTDSARLSEWMTDFVSFEPIMNREDVEGNSSILRMMSGSDTLTMRQEIVQFDTAERFVVEFESSMANGAVDVQLTAVPSGTELLTRTRLEGSSWIWRSLFPLMTGGIKRTQQADYDRLAVLVDEAPVPLEGDWAGVDGLGNEQMFHFRTDGEMRWEAASGGERFALNGVEWELDREAVPMTLDLTRFDRGPLAGMALYGILEFQGDDSLRVDLEAGPIGQDRVRPTDFTESTATLHRVR